MSRADDAGGRPSDSEAPTEIAGSTRSGVGGELTPGQRLGRHVVEQELGRGGMGVVWSARDEQLGRRVAVKAIGPALAEARSGLERFVREARLLASLNHPNLATVHDLLWHEGRPLLVMELLEGEDLARRLARGPLTSEETLRVGIQVASALGAAHERGIVHRDLKPANVQLLPSGLVKVLDFGVAHAWRDPGVEHEMGPAGTPAYMSPEQAICRPLDARSDLFSFGLVLLECLTARRVSIDARASSPSAEDPRSEVDWSKLAPEPPPGLQRLITSCLRTDRDERPASAAQVRHDLRVELRQVDGDSAPEIVRRRHLLPLEPDSFVGRSAELEALAARMKEGARLITVHGPGGVGKTRLVTRHCWSRLDAHAGGAWFCDLAEASDLDGIASALARTLDVPLGRGDAIEQLGHALAGRGDCMVVLDNFEQVADHAEAAVGRWLERAPEARFIVTSRVLLDLAAETVLHVEPLVVDGPALELFEQRARARQQDFALTDENREQVQEIVCLLDGLPLAIELAAARIRLLSPARLVERMKDRFELLSGASRTGERQATLKAAIDWSWDLLEPWEQAALAQLSVFEGGFTLEAAESVLDLAAWDDAPWPLDAVQALLDKSLLRTWMPEQVGRRHGADESRFGTYVSIREYASEKLRTKGAIAHGASGADAERGAFVRHGEHFARFGTEEAIESLAMHGGVGRRRALERELENLVSACRRALSRGDASTAAAVYRAAWAVLELKGPFHRGHSLGSEVLAAEGLSASERARVLLATGRASHQLGRMDEAHAFYERALALGRELTDRGFEASVLNELGGAHFHQGLLEPACELYEQSLAIAREIGNRSVEAAALGNQGLSYWKQGRPVEARSSHERALVIHREVGNRYREGLALVRLAILHWEQGRLQEARALHEQALAIHREVGDRASEGDVLCNIGNLDCDEGHPEAGRSLYEEALAIHREVGKRRQEGVVLAHLAILHDLSGRTAEALELYEQALAIHREVRDRRNEGHVLGNMGGLHAEQGRLDEARALHEEALAIHREVGDRSGQGIALGNLGSLHSQQGRTDEARSAFDAGEALLRELKHGLQLGLLLCARGRAAAADDMDAARACLAEAETLAAQVGAGTDSELGRELARLREAAMDGGGEDA